MLHHSQLRVALRLAVVVAAACVSARPAAPQGVLDPLEEAAYLKASNTESGDRFGVTLAMWGDTLVVGAPAEDSIAVGVDGDQSSNARPGSGALYVFDRTVSGWEQQAYIKPGTFGGDGFGTVVDLWRNVLVAGTEPEEDERVWVYERGASGWSYAAALEAGAMAAGSEFGAAVAVSERWIAVGVPGWDGKLPSTPGPVGGDDHGVVILFRRGPDGWQQHSVLQHPNTSKEDEFGASIALHGRWLAVGAPGEDSGTPGVNQVQTTNKVDSGAVYLFELQDDAWLEHSFVKPSQVKAGQGFGEHIALSSDALVVGVPQDPAGQQGAFLVGEGAAYVFTRDGESWSEQLRSKPRVTVKKFGGSVAVAGDCLAVADRDGMTLMRRRNGTWLRESRVTPQHADVDDLDAGPLGSNVAVAEGRVALGAPREAGASTGVDGDPLDNSAPFAGAVHVWEPVAEDALQATPWGPLFASLRTFFGATER